MIKVGILGATGYTGVELVRLLLGHSEAEIAYVSSETFSGKKLADVYPSIPPEPALILEPFEDADRFIGKLAEKIDLIFMAYPHGKAAYLAPKFIEKGVKVIDLSADFRIKNPSTFTKWYQVPPPEAEYLAQAVFGLPEIYREEIQKADLVANPGCYPTATILSLRPLLTEKIIGSNIVVDAKSGVSGAGRTPRETNIFSFCNDNFMAYSVNGHRHQPEIAQELDRLNGAPVGLTFQTHLVPMTRGIFVTIYADLKKDVTEDKVREIFGKYYAAEKFVRVLPPDIWPATKNVYGSNLCQINFKIKPENKKIIIFGVIDNLIKGASGQAVQNMNLVMGFDESLGLGQTPIVP